MNRKIGIICAVESEKNEILKKYTNYAIERVYDFEFYTFNINSINFVMVKCGVGKINAARATQVLIDKYNVIQIINYGTAGGIVPYLKHGDIVLARSCVQVDADCTVFGVEKGKFEKDDELYVKCNEDYLLKIKDKLGESGYRVYIENVATFDQFIINKKFNDDLVKQFNVVCADMESVAIAIVCNSCNVPYVIIRGISNILNDKEPISSYNSLSSGVSSDCVSIISKIIC